MNPRRFGRLDAAGAAIAVAMTAAFYTLGVEPLRSARAANDAARQGVAAAQSTLDRARTELRDLERRLAEVRRAMAAAPLRLESTARMNTRVAEFNTLASARGLELDEVRPGAPSAGPWFTEVPIRIAGSGPYASCLFFLHALAVQFPDTGVASIELRGDPTTDDTPAIFTFDLVWYAAPRVSADATK
jgi:Tfp pilus assembly protein PilO